MLVAVGLGVAMTGVVTDLVALAVVGFFFDGIGIAVWDVSMNVEAAEIERRFGRTMMPRFHAGWSIGSFAGAAVGIPMAALHAPLLLHVPGFALLAAGGHLARGGRLPAADRSPTRTARPSRARRGGSPAPWRSGSWCWPSPSRRAPPTTGSRSR